MPFALPALSLDFLRIVIGLSFLITAAVRVYDGQVDGYMRVLPGTAGVLLAWLITGVELVGGIALIVGRWVRPFGYTLAAWIVLAAILSNRAVGFDAASFLRWQLSLLMFAATLAVAANGRR